MRYSRVLQYFSFGEITIKLWVPNNVQETYQALKKEEPDTAFPYWAQVWPSALALAGFITENPHFVADKKVLELAAGVGLPGLLAAQLQATEVIISDYVPEAIQFQQSSVTENQLAQVSCQLIDWFDMPQNIDCDTVLLSDINYDPAVFEQLFTVLTMLLKQGCTLLLTTPQRLMAKPFLEKLLPWQMDADAVEIQHNGQSVTISVWVLKQTIDNKL